MALTTTTAGRSRSLIEYSGAVLIGCIAAVAIAAAVIASDNRPPAGGSLTAERLATSQASSHETGLAQTVLYLVDSQEKADRIAVAEHEWLLSFIENNVAPSFRTFSIIVATTPEEAEQAQQLATLASQELMQVGLPFKFIDLRGE
jgi:hypothetical protein